MEKMEQSKEFIEEVERLQTKHTSLVYAFQDLGGFRYNNLWKFVFGSGTDDNINQITFAKIWAGEIELVEKKPKYVIYQIDDECHPWLLGIGVYGTLKNLPDFNANQPCEHEDYANKNCHFDQKFAFAMRDTGKFKIQKVVIK